MTVEWLVANLDSVLILDTRKQTESYAEGHIPGAILVDVNRIRVDRKILINMRPDAAVFQQFMRDHGVNDDSTVDITHPGETPGQVAGAARLYWNMKYYGFDRVSLLDGGNRAWVAPNSKNPSSLWTRSRRVTTRSVTNAPHWSQPWSRCRQRSIMIR